MGDKSALNAIVFQAAIMLAALLTLSFAAVCAGTTASAGKATIESGETHSIAMNGGNLRIVSVSPGSLAERMGLDARDIIAKLNGTKFTNAKEFIAAVQRNGLQSVEIVRDEKRFTIYAPGDGR